MGKHTADTPVERYQAQEYFHPDHGNYMVVRDTWVAGRRIVEGVDPRVARDLAYASNRAMYGGPPRHAMANDQFVEACTSTWEANKRL